MNAYVDVEHIIKDTDNLSWACELAMSEFATSSTLAGQIFYPQ